MSDLSLSHLDLIPEEKFIRASYNWLKPDIKPKNYFTDEDFASYEELMQKIHYPDLEDYKNIIGNIKPDLILMGGDVFHAGQTAEDLQELIELFEFCEEKIIQCYLIEGNHEEDNYKRIVEKIREFNFIEDISNKTVNYNGLKILGINFEYANRIGICKRLTNLFNESYDIVLTHTPDNKRIWFFELDTKYLITGHSGVDLGIVKNKIYIANDYTPKFYFVIDYYSSNEQKITFYKDNQLWAKLNFKNKKHSWQKKQKHLNYFGVGYSASYFNRIIRLKRKIGRVGRDEQNEIIQKIVDKRDNHNWVRDYIGNHYFKDKLFFECDICGNKYHQNAGLNWHMKVTHKKK